MIDIFVFLSSLWFIRTSKAILFWLYLWQLKEYHCGRFLDHFRTEKGKKLLFNKVLGLKIVLVLLFFKFQVLVLYVAFFLYLFEAIKWGWDFLVRRMKKPVLTKKTALLIFIGLLIEVLFLFVLFEYIKDILIFVFWLLVFDVLVPLIISTIVLSLQPLTVLARNQIIKKAKEKRGQFKDLLVIGITGSYGKTSTKEFLAAILAKRFEVLKTKEHQNSEIGVSQCILNDLKPKHEIFICEMGAYNKGGIKLLCDIAKPKIGILTGINEQHMATFGSQENIINAKYELIESLPENGLAFFNGNNKYCLELYSRTRIKKILYGQEVELTGTENILSAIAVAKELGMTEEEINKVVERIKNRTGGFQLKNGINGLKIIDATYSANPDGVMVHLDYLKSFPGKKVIIMPCLIELGPASKDVHKRIGKKIGEVCDLAIITTKERFEEIKQGAPEALFIERPKEILKKIESFCKQDDIILLESRVPKQVIKQLIISN